MEIDTPHDPEARYSQKVTAAGQRDWIGCRDHQTETCDETSPNVIVQVLTRPAPPQQQQQQDSDALDDIHHQLARQGFQPLEHVVDGGYVTPDTIHHVALTWAPLLGPVRDDPQAAQRPGSTKGDFHINWENRTLTCPNGITSPPWKPTLGGHPRLSVRAARQPSQKRSTLMACATAATATAATAAWQRHTSMNWKLR